MTWKKKEKKEADNMNELENDFMARMVEQLYINREAHDDSSGRDIDYMYKIGSEQYGQLGAALAEENLDRAEKEVFHTAAILFEIFFRIREKKNEPNKTE